MEESLKIISRYNLIIRMQYVLYLQEGVSVFNSDKLPTNVIALNHLYFFNLRLVTQWDFHLKLQILASQNHGKNAVKKSKTKHAIILL